MRLGNGIGIGTVSLRRRGFAVLEDIAPVLQIAPSITGGTTIGSVLSRTVAQWGGRPAPVVTRSWYVNGVSQDQDTATLGTDLLSEGDVVDFREVATNSVGTAGVITEGITMTPVPFAPTYTGSLSISGSGAPGVVLTRTELTWDGYPPPDVTGTWTRNNVDLNTSALTLDTTGFSPGDSIGYRETATNSVDTVIVGAESVELTSDLITFVHTSNSGAVEDGVIPFPVASQETGVLNLVWLVNWNNTTVPPVPAGWTDLGGWPAAANSFHATRLVARFRQPGDANSITAANATRWILRSYKNVHADIQQVLARTSGSVSPTYANIAEQGSETTIVDLYFQRAEAGYARPTTTGQNITEQVATFGKLYGADHRASSLPSSTYAPNGQAGWSSVRVALKQV